MAEIKRSDGEIKEGVDIAQYLFTSPAIMKAMPHQAALMMLMLDPKAVQHMAQRILVGKNKIPIYGHCMVMMARSNGSACIRPSGQLGEIIAAPDATITQANISALLTVWMYLNGLLSTEHFDANYECPVMGYVHMLQWLDVFKVEKERPFVSGIEYKLVCWDEKTLSHPLESGKSVYEANRRIIYAVQQQYLKLGEKDMWSHYYDVAHALTRMLGDDTTDIDLALQFTENGSRDLVSVMQKFISQRPGEESGPTPLLYKWMFKYYDRQIELCRGEKVHGVHLISADIIAQFLKIELPEDVSNALTKISPGDDLESWKDAAQRSNEQLVAGEYPLTR